MIKQVKFKFGSAPGAAPLEFAPTNVTIFVGPNSSGKSKVLQEIHAFCTQGQPDANACFIDHLEFEGQDEDEVEETIRNLSSQPLPSEVVNSEHIIFSRRGNRYQFREDHLREAIAKPASNPKIFCNWYLQHFTIMLGGRDRISLVHPQQAGDLLSPANNSFQLLFRDNERRKRLRDVFYQAFGQYLIIDPTNLGQLRLRVSSREPTDEREERGIDAAALNFHSQAQLIEYCSDGLKAFAGMLIEVIAGDPAVLLVDEPEAFLHPSLSHKLGIELASEARASGKRIFVSTHSASFLMGCIQSGVPITIVRLTYRNGIATARILPGEKIVPLMRNPLLRSTGVLNGLFYEAVVVTESDTDRAFYQEINERLNQSGSGGIPNCLFLNATNKQTEHLILSPLRNMGIPTAGIVDIDILKDGGQTWTSYLSGGYLPDNDVMSLATTRALTLNAFKDSGQDMKRHGGLAILEGQAQESANNLLEALGRYGLFVVPGGELECWLKRLGATGDGPTWLRQVFEKMGEDPALSTYVRPAEGDVWQFMRQIARWILDPARKGIPS